jgi:hypothetical protein
LQPFDAKQPELADQFLLRAIAEELKIPLNRIARLAEISLMAEKGQSVDDQLRAIERNTTVAMQLVEGYLISLQLADSQQVLDLEPVSIGSILNDTAHQLSGMASEYGMDLEILIKGRQRLIMGNVRALKSAFLNIGATLIASQPQIAKRQALTLVSYPQKTSMVAGIYGNQSSISRQEWSRGQELYGHARQPLKNLSATNGAGLFVADTLFKAMSSRLRPSHHHKQNGLAATLSLSQQMQLV